MKNKIRLVTLISTVLLVTLPVYSQSSRQRETRTGEATISVNEQFFNSFLQAIFDNLKAPSAALIITSSDKDKSNDSSRSCPSVITLQREYSGIRTSVKFEQGKILAPLAFTGSYNSTLLNCLEFRGWASTEWELEFDRAAQVLQARIKIVEMNLENVPAMAQGSILKLVQAAIDSRINPLKLLRPEQVSSVVPVAPAGGSLRVRATEVKPEIVSGALQLRITYEFLPVK
jgi:hypothetical protein